MDASRSVVVVAVVKPHPYRTGSSSPPPSWLPSSALVSLLDTLPPRHSASTKVIVTSHLFPEARFSEDRLRRISELVGKDRLVVDVRYRWW